MSKIAKYLCCVMTVVFSVALYEQPVTAETTVHTERSYNKPSNNKKNLKKEKNQAQTDTEKSKKQDEEQIKNEPVIDVPNNESGKSESNNASSTIQDKNIEQNNDKTNNIDASQPIDNDSSNTKKIEDPKNDTISDSDNKSFEANSDGLSIAPVEYETNNNTQELSNVSQTSLPHPMSYNEAVKYQLKHNNEIELTLKSTKDTLGNKAKAVLFDFMGKDGFVNSGDSLVAADYTKLRLYISYGYDTKISPPIAYLAWGANMEGKPDKGFAPSGLNVIFSDGYVKNLKLQGYTFTQQLYEGIFWSYSWSFYYYGSIALSNDDIYEMVNHGNVVACHLTTNYGGLRHLFYSGEKNLEHKQAMTRGLKHIAVMMDVNQNTIKNEHIYRANLIEAARNQRLHDEVKADILNEQEKEKMKAEIMEELRREGKI